MFYRRMEHLRCLGLPCYPPLEVQYALNRATLRWRVHSITSSWKPPVPGSSSHPGDILLLGTNHLLPWNAARVAEAVQFRVLSKGSPPPPPLASIALELNPARHATLDVVSQMMEPVLAELGHPRFARMPDLRALQRLTGSDTREHLSSLLEAIGMEAMDLRIFGFVEGMELMQAIRLGRLHNIPVTCIDKPMATDRNVTDTLKRLTDYEIGEGTAPVQVQQETSPAHHTSTQVSSSTTLTSSSSAPSMHIKLQDRSALLSQLVLAHKAAQQAQQSCTPLHPFCEQQAAWHKRATELLEHGVDRGLVVGDEHACMFRYMNAWGEPAALARPWQFHGTLGAGHGWSGSSLNAHGNASEFGGAGLHGGGQEGSGSARRTVGGMPEHGGGDDDGDVQVERELHMAWHISQLPRPVLAVMGAAHVAGVKRALALLFA